jgi:hypothetical protein
MFLPPLFLFQGWLFLPNWVVRIITLHPHSITCHALSKSASSLLPHLSCCIFFSLFKLLQSILVHPNISLKLFQNIVHISIHAIRITLFNVELWPFSWNDYPNIPSFSFLHVQFPSLHQVHNQVEIAFHMGASICAIIIMLCQPKYIPNPFSPSSYSSLIASSPSVFHSFLLILIPRS